LPTTTRLYLIYSEAYFSADQVKALAERWLLILEQGLEAVNLPVADFDLSTPEETALLQQWNATRVDYPAPTTLRSVSKRRRCAAAGTGGGCSGNA
jgi:arthrofactin-type cyclic lipopeptide synthetase A